MADGLQGESHNTLSVGARVLSTSPLSSRLVRYADLKPCFNAFVDTRTPGSDTKENFTIVGPGVSENPNQHVHIPEPHGFNIGGARQPPGCLNSQHSHNTAEVFVVHSGQWRFLYGVDATDAYVDLSPGDTISIPVRMFRGFKNTGDTPGFLFAVLGGDDPGKVTWAPSVFKLAEQYGLVLLEGGRLVDIAAGDEVPVSAVRQQAPGNVELAALRTPSSEELAGCVAPGVTLRANPASSLMAIVTGGVSEAGVITPVDTPDGFKAGPITGWWGHGFNLRRITMDSGSALSAHTRQEAEVVFVQAGELTVATAAGEKVHMGPGDTLSLPVGMIRSWTNSSAVTTTVFVVRGGESPKAAVAA